MHVISLVNAFIIGLALFFKMFSRLSGASTAAFVRRLARSMPSSRVRTSSSRRRPTRSFSTTRRSCWTTATSGRPRSPPTSKPIISIDEMVFLWKCWRWTSVKNKAIPSVVVLTIILVFLFSSPHKDRLSVGMSELSPHWWIGTAQCYILRESPRVVCVLLVCTLHFPSSTKRLLVERTQVPPSESLFVL